MVVGQAGRNGLAVHGIAMVVKAGGQENVPIQRLLVMAQTVLVIQRRGENVTAILVKVCMSHDKKCFFV